jgi:hypothetical protein
MVGTIFLILVLIALGSNCSNLMMRIRLAKRLPSENGLSWWMRSSDEVGRTYQELFPGSYLPSIVQVCVLGIFSHGCCRPHAHFVVEIKVTAARS